MVRTAFRADRLRSAGDRWAAAWRAPRESASVVTVPQGWRNRALVAARERAAWDWVRIRFRAAFRAAARRVLVITLLSPGKGGA